LYCSIELSRVGKRYSSDVLIRYLHVSSQTDESGHRKATACARTAADGTTDAVVKAVAQIGAPL
jgi:hypothetical protein